MMVLGGCGVSQDERFLTGGLEIPGIGQAIASRFDGDDSFLAF